MSLVRICCVTQGAALVLCDNLGGGGWGGSTEGLFYHDICHTEFMCVHLHLRHVLVCSQNEILEVKLMDIRGGTFWDLD